MGVPTYGTDLVRDDRQYDNSISQVPVSSFRAFGAAFHEAWLDNPISSIYRMSEMTQLRADEGQTSGLISKEIFERRHGALGLTWDNRMTWGSAEVLNQRKTRELQNRFIMGRGNLGLAGNFGASLIASFLDPVNIAMAFLPIISAPKYAQIAARSSRALGVINRGLIQAPRLVSAAEAGNTFARLQIGFIDAMVGNVILEPLTLSARNQEQADYTFMDSLNNVIIGSILGAGMHAGFGKISDIYSNRGMARIQADMRATESAARQMIDGKTPDVSALHMMHDAEITINSQSLNINDRSVETDINLHAMELGELPEITVLNRSKAGVEVGFARDSGHGMTGFGTTIEKARESLTREFSRLHIEAKANNVKLKSQQLQNKLESLVSDRNYLRNALSSKKDPELAASLEQMRKQLKELNSPDSLQLKLRELGFPTEALDQTRAKLDALRTQTNRASRKGKGKEPSKADKKKDAKKLKEEVEAQEAFLRDFVRRNDEGKFAESKELLRRERATLRKNIKKAEVSLDEATARARLSKVSKEIGRTRLEIEKAALERTQATLDSQRLSEGDLFFTPKMGAEELAESVVPLRTNDEAFAQSSLDEINQRLTPEEIKGLSPEMKKIIDDADEFEKFIATSSKAQLEGIRCMAGAIVG